MKKVFIVVLLFLTQFFSSALLADEYYNYIQMTCNPTEIKVELENIDQWDDRPSDSDYSFKGKTFQNDDFNLTTLKIYKAGECTFSNGKKVRLKLGSGEAVPYGQCGASPASWFSLWVDEKKILSQYDYIPTCLAESSLKSIKVQDDAVEICEYNTTGSFASLEIHKESFTCKTFNVGNSEKDNNEYPTGKKKLPAGTKILEYGSDDPLCQAFIKDDWHNTQTTKIYSITWPFCGANNLTRDVVDIDNDGSVEVLYSDSRWGRFEYTHIYILDKNEYAVSMLFDDLSGLNKFSKKYEEQCTSIMTELKKETNETIPQSWAKDSKLILSQSGKTIDIPHEISPVVYQGRTYLSFYSNDLWGLLEYKSNKEFEEKCLYSKIKENY
jgi:hypothetical protein